MKKLIGVLSILMLVSVMGHAGHNSGYTPPGDGLPEGSRVTQKVQYSGGVMASIENYVNGQVESISVFDNGNMVKTYLVEDPNNPIYLATYVNGQLVSSMNQYGDVTKYDANGRKESVTHMDPSGESWVVEKNFQYDDYGRLISSERKVPDEDAVDENDEGANAQGGSWQTSKYAYSGTQLLSVTTYNDAGDKLSVVKYSGNDVLVYDINSDGVEVLVEKTTTDPSTGLRSGEQYDAETGKVTATVEYDIHGRRTKVKDATPGAEGRTIQEDIYDGAMHTSTKLITYYPDGSVFTTNTRVYDQYNNWTETVTKTFQPGTWTSYDPWTFGTLTMIDGHLALLVNPNDVEGKSFYNFDPTALTGETKTDENGNLIIMVAVDDDATQAELEALVGQQVNLMWQYYSKASESGGYAWIRLAPTDDRIVAIHLNGDSEAKVEQWGGDWDRSKQYVVIS